MQQLITFIMVKFSENSRLEIIDEDDYISTDQKYIEFKSNFQYVEGNKVNYDTFYYDYLTRLDTFTQNNYNYIESDDGFSFVKVQTTNFDCQDMKFLKSKIVNIDYIIKLYLNDDYKNINKIIKLYEQFIDLDPIIAFNIGLTYQLEKCYDKMMYYYNISIQNNIYKTYYNLYVYYILRDKCLAKRYLKIGYSYNDVDCCFMMGFRQIKKHKYNKAIPYLLQAYKMDNNHRNTILELSHCYGQNGQYGKMLYFLDKSFDVKECGAYIAIFVIDLDRMKTSNLNKINKKFKRLNKCPYIKKYYYILKSFIVVAKLVKPFLPK
jgi:tetratricopeptide (TPR) repeat protein